VKLARAERQLAKALKGIAGHVGHLIEGFDNDPEAIPSLMQLLERYSEALKPWAVRTSRAMLMEVDARDRDRWRDLGTAMSEQMQYDIRHAPVGEVLRTLLEEQVHLITSLPRKAAERVHKLTLEGLETSERAAEVRADILRSSEVTKSRAVLIARTETSRTATALARVRSMAAGSTHYIWHTVGDMDVRPGHRDMEGKTCEWAHPPAVKENDRVMHHHPGEIWNCRCWAEPILDLLE
jgi:SPP1 gp7 family putative phage head morphogenesis protein